MSRGYLTTKTGISSGNYLYWDSKSSCDSWFEGYKLIDFNDYAYIRHSENSKNGYNASCIHLDLKYNETTNADYIAIYNDIEGRWVYGQITDREYVNEKTTRVYFVVDFVASYYDTISLGACFIERTHVDDDWGLLYTNSKYLLNEPIEVELIHRPDLQLMNPFDAVNKSMSVEESSYTLVSPIDSSGNYSDPKIRFQAGGAVTGYTYVGSKDFIEGIAQKYVTFMTKMVNKSTRMSENINAIYLSPLPILNNNMTPTKVSVSAELIEIVKFTEMNKLKIKHAKTLDYFRYRVFTPEGEVILSQAEHGDRLLCDVYFTGSEQGTATAYFKDKLGMENGVYLSTLNWASVPLAGAGLLNKFKFIS